MACVLVLFLAFLASAPASAWPSASWELAETNLPSAGLMPTRVIPRLLTSRALANCWLTSPKASPLMRARNTLEQRLFPAG